MSAYGSVTVDSLAGYLADVLEEDPALTTEHPLRNVIHQPWAREITVKDAAGNLYRIEVSEVDR